MEGEWTREEVTMEGKYSDREDIVRDMGTQMEYGRMKEKGTLGGWQMGQGEAFLRDKG